MTEKCASASLRVRFICLVKRNGTNFSYIWQDNSCTSLYWLLRYYTKQMAKFLEIDLSEFVINDNIADDLPLECTCVCCLSQNTRFINLKTCKHKTFLEVFFKDMVSLKRPIIYYILLFVLKQFKNQIKRNYYLTKYTWVYGDWH